MARRYLGRVPPTRPFAPTRHRRMRHLQLMRDTQDTWQSADDEQLMQDTYDTWRSADDEQLNSLMAATMGGSEQAFGRLKDICWDDLVRFATWQLGDQDLAEDVVQEVLIRVWKRRRPWRRGGSARVYLYRSVRRRVIDEKRKQPKPRKRVAQWRLRCRRLMRPSTPAEELDLKERTDALVAAVLSMPERRREVFELVVLRGLSHAQTAEVMNISKQTVANQMRLARQTVLRAIQRT